MKLVNSPSARHVVLSVLLVTSWLGLSLTASESARWIPMGPGAAYFAPAWMTGLRTLVSDPQDPSFVFAVCGGERGRQALYRSTDGGLSWKGALNNVFQVVVQPATSQVFALVSSGQTMTSSIWKSTDQGKTFFRIGTRLPYQQMSLLVHPTNPNVIVLTGFGISTDGGLHWAAFNPPQSTIPGSAYSFAGDMIFSPFSPDTMYANAALSYVNGGYRPVVLISYNLGRSWKPLVRADYGLFYPDPVSSRVFSLTKNTFRVLTPRGWRAHSTSLPPGGVDPGVFQIIGVPHHPERLLALQLFGEALTRVLQSNDGGLSWTVSPVSLKGYGVISTITSLDDRLGTVLAGTDGAGVLRRDELHGWALSNSGLNEAVVAAAGGSGSAIYGITGTTDDTFVFRTSDLGKSWDNLFFRRGFPFVHVGLLSLAVDPARPRHLYVSTSNNLLSESTDGGDTWEKTDPYLFADFDPVRFGTIYFGGPGTNGFLIARSTDGGKHLTSLPTISGCHYVLRVVIDENDGQNLFFPTLGCGLYKSSDAGMTVRQIASRLGPNLLDLAPIRDERNAFLLITTKTEIYKTTDGGDTWNRISRVAGTVTQDDQYLTELVAADRSGARFFALFSGRLFESTDGARSWSEITNEFGQQSIIFGLTDPVHAPFYIATNHGVFTSRQVP